MAQRTTKTTKKVESKKIDNKSEIINDELVEESAVATQNVAVASEGVVDVDGDSSSNKKKRVLLTRDMVLESFDEIINLIDGEISSLRDSQTKTKGVKFLRTLGKRIKTLRNHSARLIKQRNTSNKKASTNNSNSGFLKPVPISKEMAKFTGWDAAQLKSRVDVTKFLCNYIKENDLQNPKDRRQILADSKLSKLLKYDTKKETEPLTYFRIQSCLKEHFVKPQTV